MFALNEDTDMEWGGFKKGIGIDDRWIARQLKPFSIFPAQIKQFNLKGYSLTETNPRQDGVILQEVIDAHVPDDYYADEIDETTKPVGTDHAYDANRNETETLTETNISHDNQEVSDVSEVSVIGEGGKLGW